MPDFVYLASRSPRRRELLAQIGLRVGLIDVAVEELPLAEESAAEMVVRLAGVKARAAAQAAGDTAVIAADTTVSLDGELFGKPLDAADARRMLERLSGRTHEVHTGVAVLFGGRCETALSRSLVRMRPITGAEIGRYWQTGEPGDKAGAYAIQGHGAVFIAGLEGSFSGVMGLPLFETAQLLAGCGYRFPQLPSSRTPAGSRHAG